MFVQLALDKLNISSYKKAVKSHPQICEWLNGNHTITDYNSIIIGAAKESDIVKETGFNNKNASLISKIQLKSLQVAETVLASLLLKSPIKAGIAFNVIHSLIVQLKRDIRKDELEEILTKSKIKAQRTFKLESGINPTPQQMLEIIEKDYHFTKKEITKIHDWNLSQFDKEWKLYLKRKRINY